MNYRKKFSMIFGLLLVTGLVLAACQPQVVEVEKIVEVEKVVEVEVEVEKVVEVEVEVEKVVEVEVEKVVEVAVEAGWEAKIIPAEQAWKIGYGDGLAGIPFTDSVTDSINEVANLMGVEIVHCDNAYDQEKTVECANLLVTQEVDGIIFANWIAGSQELIAGIFTDAGLPCVAYDGPHPGCAAFGPDNYLAGVEAGRFLGQYAIDQGWDAAETQLLLVWTPNVPVHKDRADGATDGVRELFAVPDENVHDIPTEGLDDTYPNVTTWATGHPDAKHVLCFGHSDQPGVDCAVALEQAGYLGNAVAVGTGASTEALVDLRGRTDDESVFKATISYFPERYGLYLVPAIVDMIEGRAVPEEIIPSVSPVTRANVLSLYPPECEEYDKVIFQQSWIPDAAQFTAFAGEASGAWEKYCLDVELVPGGPQVGALAISLADTGERDIASMGSTANFVVQYNEGANVVAFAQTYQNAPSGIVHVVENPDGEKFDSWDSMADIKGKKVGLPAGALVAWTIMMEHHGLSADDYEIIQTGFDFTPLLDGSVDAIWAYETNFPVEMTLQGFRVEMLRVADNGYKVPGDFIFTNKDYLEENEDILCRFIKGQDEALRWGLEHVEEVVDHVIAKHGEEFKMEKDFQIGKAGTAAKLISDWEHPKGLTYIDPVNWERTLDILLKYEIIDEKPDVNDVVSTVINSCVYGK